MRRSVLVALLACAALRSGDAAELGCSSIRCINLVFDGDSISAGTGAAREHSADRLVARAVGHVRMYNVAVGGRPMAECLRLYPELVAPLFVPGGPPNVIVLRAGDDDIAHGRTGAQTYAVFTAYVAAAHRQGWKVVVSTELKRPDFLPPKAAELEGYNDRVRRNKAGADAVVDLDTEPKFADPANRSDPTVFSRDKVHLSDGGYAVLANMLTPAVNRVGGR